MIEGMTIKHDQGMNWQEMISHKTKEYHLYIMTYGSCTFTCNEVTILASKGDFILTPQQTNIIEETPHRTIHQKFSFQFTASDELYKILPMLQTETMTHSSSGLFDRTMETFRPIWNEHGEDYAYTSLRASSFLLDTLALWQRELDRGELAPASIMHIDRMKAYIQSHYREHITKEHLGDYIRRSPNYVANLFKKGTGQTISEYIHSIRMKTAIYMLSQSVLTITEISDYLGYSDVSYFQRIFKRTYGKPASKYMDDRRSNDG